MQRAKTSTEDSGKLKREPPADLCNRESVANISARRQHHRGNTRRTGEFILDGRRYLLRRVLFPENVPPEYFVIDLLQQYDMAGIALSELEHGLVATLSDD